MSHDGDHDKVSLDSHDKAPFHDNDFVDEKLHNVDFVEDSTLDLCSDSDDNMSHDGNHDKVSLDSHDKLSLEVNDLVDEEFCDSDDEGTGSHDYIKQSKLSYNDFHGNMYNVDHDKIPPDDNEYASNQIDSS